MRGWRRTARRPPEAWCHCAEDSDPGLDPGKQPSPRPLVHHLAVIPRCRADSASVPTPAVWCGTRESKKGFYADQKQMRANTRRWAGERRSRERPPAKPSVLGKACHANRRSSACVRVNPPLISVNILALPQTAFHLWRWRLLRNGITPVVAAAALYQGRLATVAYCATVRANAPCRHSGRNRLAHALERNWRTRPPHHAAQRSDRHLGQQDDRASRMQEELDPIAWLQPEMVADRLRNRHSSPGRNRRFHDAPLLHSGECRYRCQADKPDGLWVTAANRYVRGAALPVARRRRIAMRASPRQSPAPNASAAPP